MKFKSTTLRAAFGLSVLAALTGCSKSPTKAQLDDGAELCHHFISTQMRGSGDFAPKLETKIFDSYMKEDKLVFDVGYREKDSERAYVARKCIIDEKAGTITAPEPTDHQWDK